MKQSAFDFYDYYHLRGDSVHIDGTRSLKIPSGTTSQRPVTSSAMLRHNSQENWTEVGLDDSWLILVDRPNIGTFVNRSGDSVYGDLRFTNNSRSIHSNGTVNNPSITFLGDEDTGLYRDSDNSIGIVLGSSLNNTPVLHMTRNDNTNKGNTVTINGDLVVTGTASQITTSFTNILTLNKNGTNVLSGIEVEIDGTIRGRLMYSYSDTEWSVDNNFISDVKYAVDPDHAVNKQLLDDVKNELRAEYTFLINQERDRAIAEETRIEGRLYTREELDDIVDVTISSPQDRESLIYDSYNNVFVNATRLLSDNNDVTLTTPIIKDTLCFNGSEWINQQLDVNDLFSVNVSNPVEKDYMYFDGTQWINRPLNVETVFGEGIKTTIGDVTQDINGFPTRVDSEITFNDVDKSVTITPINTEFDVMYRGKTITINTPQTLNFTQTSGGRYIIIDPNTGQLIEGNERPSIINYLLCAYVYYNAVSDKIVIKGDERHSSSRDTTWHRSKHIEQGMVHRSGGVLSYSLTDPSTITVGVATPLVVADEDLEHAIIHSDTPTNPFEQILDSNAQLPVIYIDSTGYYTQDNPTTTPYKMGVNNIAYNKITGGLGTQEDVDNGKFMNYYIVVTNCTKYPVKVIQGREQYETEVEAQHESLHLLNLPFPELTALHQLIVQVDTSITENPFKITLVAALQPVKDMFSGTIIGSGSSANEIRINNIAGIAGNSVQDVLEVLASNKANTSTQIITGSGLTGGGDLSANRTFNVSYGTTAGTAVQGNDTRIVNAVPNTRTITAGSGLTGGGNLSANRSLSVSYGTTAGTAAQGNDSRIVNAVPTTRTITAGSGLTGGGDLSANQTLSLAASSSTVLGGLKTRLAGTDLHMRSDNSNA